MTIESIKALKLLKKNINHREKRILSSSRRHKDVYNAYFYQYSLNIKLLGIIEFVYLETSLHLKKIQKYYEI